MRESGDGKHQVRIFSSLQRNLSLALESGAADSIHKLRTTLRRLEALARHASIEPEEDKALLQLEKFRKLAGKVRDLDVQLAALETVQVGRARESRGTLGRVLEEARARRLRKLQKHIEAEDSAKLTRRLKKLRRKLEESTHATSEPALIVGKARRLFAVLARQYPLETPQRLEAEHLHGIRLACKQVRYTAELAGDFPEGRLLVAQMRNIQDAIGEWHDWQMLLERAQKVLPRAIDRPLLSAIRNTLITKFAQAVEVVAQQTTEVLANEPRKPSGRVSADSSQTTRRAG